MMNLRDDPIDICVPPIGFCAFTSRHSRNFKMQANAWNFDKFCWIVEGKGTFDWEDVHFPLNKDDVIFIPAHTYHCFLDRDPMTLAVLCIDPQKICSEERLFSSYQSITSKFRSNTPFTMHDPWMRTRIFEILKQLIAEDYVKDVASELSKSCLFYEVLIVLTRFLQNQRDSSPNRDDGLEMLIQQLQRKFTEPHSVSELAKSCSLSVRGFSRLFKEKTGKSPIQWIVDKRLSYAAHLLSQQTSVTSTAFSSGFSDTAHFYRAFKQRYGLSPKQYRIQKPFDNS